MQWEGLTGESKYTQKEERHGIKVLIHFRSALNSAALVFCWEVVLNDALQSNIHWVIGRDMQHCSAGDSISIKLIALL